MPTAKSRQGESLDLLIVETAMPMLAQGLKAVHHCSYPDSKPASVQHVSLTARRESVTDREKDTVLLLHTHLENSHWSATATDLERKLIHVYDSKGIRLSRVNVSHWPRCALTN